VTTNDTGTGISVHFLATINVHTRPDSYASSRLFNYGDELLMTPEIVEANRDRLGRRPLLDLLHDEGEQVRRFGRRVIAPGPWPEGLSRIQPGSHQWDDAREDALAAASLLPTEEERKVAREQARAVWGMPDSAKSRTIATYGPSR
jgi:hypothetical protein